VRTVSDGPRDGSVLQFEGRRFAGSINLKERGIQISRCDLLAVQVKAGRAAFLTVSIDYYPWSGKQARWYVLDGMRGPLGWQTIWVDLRRPEEGRPRRRHAPNRRSASAGTAKTPAGPSKTATGQ